MIAETRSAFENRLRRALFGAAFACAFLATTGCQSTLYQQTGRVMSGYATDHMLPALMAKRDVDMACQSALSLMPFIESFERVGADVHRATLVSALAAGICAEERAREAELVALAALRRGDAAAVQDARIVEKKAHLLAAQRFLSAYEHDLLVYGATANRQTAGACPALTDAHMQQHLLGLCAGVLATIHDKAAEGAALVPKATPAQIVQALDCLQGAPLWGVPEALRAAVVLGLPSGSKAREAARQSLMLAAEKGDEQGVRLASALVTITLSAAADPGLKAEIKRIADSFSHKPGSASQALLDGYAARIVTHESDKLWTQARGHRTPFGALGRFWDDDAGSQVPAPVPGDDDLLHGL